MPDYQLYIDGQFCDAEGGKTADSINPATEEPWARVARASRKDTQRAIAAALSAGNTLVLKPASDTPCSALELAKIIDQTDLPKGVVNVVHGSGAECGEELCTSPLVDKVALTGSTEVGRRVQQLASGTIKKVTLELGGKSANIILDDADLEMAIDGSLFGCFFHQGQACESGTRLF